MNPYRIHEGEFKLPGTWLDQSMNIFKIPAADGANDASIVVSRDYTAADKPFAEYLQQQKEAAETQLPQFKWLRQEDTLVNDQPAAVLEFTWKRETQTFYLRQALVKRPEVVLIFTLTASPEDREHYLPAWDTLIASLVLNLPA